MSASRDIRPRGLQASVQKRPRPMAGLSSGLRRLPPSSPYIDQPPPTDKIKSLAPVLAAQKWRQQQRSTSTTSSAAEFKLAALLTTAKVTLAQIKSQPLSPMQEQRMVELVDDFDIYAVLSPVVFHRLI